MGVYDLAAIMACMGFKLRGNAEKEKIKVVGGESKKLPFRRKIVLFIHSLIDVQVQDGQFRQALAELSNFRRQRLQSGCKFSRRGLGCPRNGGGKRINATPDKHCLDDNLKNSLT